MKISSKLEKYLRDEWSFKPKRTYWNVMEWLRLKFHMYLHPLEHEGGWMCTVMKYPSREWSDMVQSKKCDDYYDALDEGIIKSLEMYKHREKRAFTAI